MILISSCICLCSIHRSQVLSREWRCSWSSADRRCSNYIWVINNFIAYSAAAYIRGLTVFYWYLVIIIKPLLRIWRSGGLYYWQILDKPITGLPHGFPDNKIHEAYMGPIWGRQDPGMTHVGPMNLAMRVSIYIHATQWNVITHPCPNFNSGLTKPPLKFGHR